MSLKVCGDCGCAYLASVELCPHCGGGTYKFSWEQDMPKATVEGGGSDYRGMTPQEAAGELTRLGEELEPDVNRPNQNHPKEAWVAYAVAQGADPAEASAMSKKDLIAAHS